MLSQSYEYNLYISHIHTVSYILFLPSRCGASDPSSALIAVVAQTLPPHLLAVAAETRPFSPISVVAQTLLPYLLCVVAQTLPPCVLAAPPETLAPSSSSHSPYQSLAVAPQPAWPLYVAHAHAGRPRSFSLPALAFASRYSHTKKTRHLSMYM